jgi:Phage endonuclease I
MSTSLRLAVAAHVEAQGIDLVYQPHTIEYETHHSYIPDFTLENGVILETQGWLSEKDRIKMLAVKKQNPNLDVRYIFQAPNNKIPETGQTYAQWAEDNGIQWAPFYAIPIEWLT